MSRTRRDHRRGSPDRLLKADTDKDPRKATSDVELQPAMKQLGITSCPVCKREVAVFLTKTRRPFLNCSFCSVRVFYNGREAMRRLQKKMQATAEEVER